MRFTLPNPTFCQPLVRLTFRHPDSPTASLKVANISAPAWQSSGARFDAWLQRPDGWSKIANSHKLMWQSTILALALRLPGAEAAAIVPRAALGVIFPAGRPADDIDPGRDRLSACKLMAFLAAGAEDVAHQVVDGR